MKTLESKNVAPELEKRTLTMEDGEIVEYEVSSGNVFADLGLEDAEELQFKTRLIVRIQAAITERGLTQAEAAKLIGLDQSRLSKMMRGGFLSFSSDKLFDILNRLGRRVEVRVLDDVAEGEARTLLVA